MKIYNILFCGAMLLSAAALTGCSEDETYDVYGEKTNRVFVDPNQSNVTECTVYKTPIGLCGDALTNVHVRMQYPAQQTVKVGGAADMSLVAEYNEQNSTEYAALPDAAVKALEISPAEMESGKNTADLQVSLPTEARTSLTESDYVLPIRISTPGGKDDGREISTLDDKSMAYLVIHTSDEDIASLTGSKTVDCNIVNTPVGVFGGVDSKFTVALKASVYTDVQLSAEIDNSLIAAYNEENGTSYEALPSDFASVLKVNAATIKPGELSGDVAVTMDSEKAKQLSGSYIVPMHIAMTYSDGTKKVFDEPVYTTIDVKETLINDNATSIPGTKGDVKTYSVVSAENLDPEEFSGLFSDDWDASWPFLEKKETAAFTVDLGAEKNLVAFNIDNYVGKEYTLYFSNDGNTWKEIGSTEGHTAVYDRSTWEQAYVMYGAVKCRYIKAEMKLDTNSWAWSYGSYAAISALNFYFK